MTLRTVDFSGFLHGTEEQRQQVAAELVDCLKSLGFVRLINHEVPDKTIEGLLEQSKRFFTLPTSEKVKIANDPGPHPQRGWSRIGMEQTAKLREENLAEAAGREVSDKKEHFDAGPLGDEQYPNKWPESMPDFQPFVQESYQICQRTCFQIISAIELGLGLEAGRLTQCCQPAASEIRLLYYPPTTRNLFDEGLKKRAWPHTDLGIITLLFQDMVGGLEVEDRGAGKPRSFIPVRRVSPNEMIVNTSDSLQRWTNNVIRAGLHQVTAPDASKLSNGVDVLPARCSSVFFFKAGRDTSVGPLPEFVTEDRPAAFEDMTALQYQQLKTRILHGVEG
ncbi:hypothetical protein BDV33DRAFT_154224 [Aspergillus novoparasiticus]|uniref:Fe2OG dioxygenase domain-containing protein n=1 Tax=Aspergillus novoparasiticus TaxID=986946 RepID=A0A5N6F445_9EURO|nr:hypothetical protein BDV33DRAFT_154224 [Aspergillus novoparasiticus]